MTQAIVNFKDGSKSLVRVNQSYARGMVQYYNLTLNSLNTFLDFAPFREDLRNEYESKLTDAQQADWSEIAALKYDLFQVKGEYETIKRVNESLEKSVKIWEISHNEQRQKFITFLHYLEGFAFSHYVEGYPVEHTPGLRAEIENMINYFSK